MFKKILEKIKAFFISPVTTIIELINIETMKVTLIKAGVIIVTLPVVSTIINYFNIYKTVTKETTGYSRATDTEIANANKEIVKNAKLFEGLFKGILTYAIIIAVLVAIFYVIAKLLKKSPDYKKLFVLSTNYMMLNAVVIIISMLILKMSFTAATIIYIGGFFYTQLILIFALKQHLEVESTDKFVSFTAIVYAVTLIIALFVISSSLKISLDDTYKQIEALIKGLSSLKSNASSILSDFNF